MPIQIGPFRGGMMIAPTVLWVCFAGTVPIEALAMSNDKWHQSAPPVLDRQLRLVQPFASGLAAVSAADVKRQEPSCLRWP